jgi:uncharacterized protein YjbJ (UPF0337 family)
LKIEPKPPPRILKARCKKRVGEVTGNPEDKAEGKAKQAEAALEHSVENVKDELKKAID